MNKNKDDEHEERGRMVNEAMGKETATTKGE